jgi:hypothetical protein
MEHDWMVERELRERSRRLHDASPQLNRSDELGEDGEDGAKPPHDGVSGWAQRPATEIIDANIKLDALGVARSARDSDVDYTLAERIQVLADLPRLRR